MKRVLLLPVICAFALSAADSGAMSDTERAYLLDQLEQTKKGVLASIDGLTQAQWKFKPAPEVWSVQECAEHIILAEDYLLTSAKNLLKTDAVARPASSNAQVDKMFVAGVQDRTNKFKAPEPIVPSGKFATPADAAKEFTARRDKTIAYVKSTNDDLRTHVGKGPAGPMDAYQFLLLLSSHSARHTAQIREVEANEGFPKPTQ